MSAPAPQLPARPSPKQRHFRHRWAWPWTVVAAVLGIVAGAAGGVVQGGTGEHRVATRITETVKPPPQIETITEVPAPVTVTAAPVTETVTPEPPPGPATQFGDGLYLVGTDIAPDAYRSTGPRPGGVGMCYWARLSDSAGTNIIANNVTEGPTRVSAQTGEYLEVTGCDFVRG